MGIGRGITIPALSIITIGLIYLAVVGHISISLYIYFTFWNRVEFALFAIVIVLILFFFGRD